MTLPESKPDGSQPSLEETRDLAQAHVVERFADGEYRAEDQSRLQAEIDALPDGAQRLANERQLKAACARLLGNVPIAEGLKARVMDAARLRLRGEADAIEQQLEQSRIFTIPQEEPRSVIGRLRFGRIAAAAALVFAGFLCAKLTSEYSGSREFGGSSAASMSMSGRILSADYAQAVEQAQVFLGHTVNLPKGPGIVPVRFEPNSGELDRRLVTFEYTVRIPDNENPGKYRRMPVTVLVEAVAGTAVTSVERRAEGDVTWWSIQDGPLQYHIQSESEHAVEVVSDLLGWPKSGG